MRKAAIFMALAALTACKRDIQNQEAVRSSIVDYLNARQAQTGLLMDSMNVEVSSLDFASSGNEAHATVRFTLKNGDASAGMTMPYTLDRKGDKWVVRAHAEGGQNPHGAMGLPSLPPNHPPVDPNGAKQQ